MPEVENLPAIPDGKGTALEGSPYRYSVHSYFITGWHPIAIARALKKEEGIELSLEDIVQYCLTIPVSDVKPGALAKYFYNRNYITNPLSDMHKLVLLQQERVMRLIILEKQKYDQDPNDPVDPKLTHQMVILERFQKDLVLTEDKLGVNRHGSVGAETTSRIAQPKTLQDLVEDANKITMTERSVSFEKDADARPGS